MTTTPDPTATPDHDTLTTYLAVHAPAGVDTDGWARALAGLPWRYVEPVVTIATRTGNHPSMVLRQAAAKSADPEFKTAAKTALARYAQDSDHA